jgi:hypothetical protein
MRPARFVNVANVGIFPPIKAASSLRARLIHAARAASRPSLRRLPCRSHFHDPGFEAQSPGNLTDPAFTKQAGCP